MVGTGVGEIPVLQSCDLLTSMLRSCDDHGLDSPSTTLVATCEAVGSDSCIVFAYTGSPPRLPLSHHLNRKYPQCTRF